jgi:hypothetical protein
MRVPATEFAKNFGRYQDEAAHEVIEVTTHDRTAGYFVSARDFDEFLKFKAHSRRVLKTEELTDATTELIRSSRMDERHKALDALLDE